MIIDSHIHVGKWSSIFYNYESTVEDAVKVMRSSGVDAAVCMPTDLTGNRYLMDKTINNKNFKFYYNAWINPEDKDLDKFLEDDIDRVSLFKVHPSIQRKRITDESYDKYMKIAAENKKPVVVHCGRWQEIASYKFPLELAEKYPDLILILAHLGGDQPSLYLECADLLQDEQVSE